MSVFRKGRHYADRYTVAYAVRVAYVTRAAYVRGVAYAMG